MIVTTAVSARVPPCSVAMTWNVPGVEPAVYFPSLLMAPPVAVQITEEIGEEDDAEGVAEVALRHGR